MTKTDCTLCNVTNSTAAVNHHTQSSMQDKQHMNMQMHRYTSEFYGHFSGERGLAS